MQRNNYSVLFVKSDIILILCCYHRRKASADVNLHLTSRVAQVKHRLSSPNRLLICLSF